MAEITITDREMILATLHPDGPIDGLAAWSVVSGNGTLLSETLVLHVINQASTLGVSFTPAVAKP